MENPKPVWKRLQVQYFWVVCIIYNQLLIVSFPTQSYRYVPRWDTVILRIYLRSNHLCHKLNEFSARQRHCNQNTRLVTVCTIKVIDFFHMINAFQRKVFHEKYLFVPDKYLFFYYRAKLFYNISWDVIICMFIQIIEFLTGHNHFNCITW